MRPGLLGIQGSDEEVFPFWGFSSEPKTLTNQKRQGAET